MIPLNTALRNGLPAPHGVPASIDFETRAIVDLKVVGSRRYAQDPHTDVLCLCVKIGPAEDVWVPGHPIPPILAEAIERGEMIAAWNASFEIAIWQEIMVKRYGWPDLPVDRFVCTMQKAALVGCPGALERAAVALGLATRKDMDGHRLMLKMCKPLPARKDEPGLRWHDDPEDHLRLQVYCMDDCRTEVMAASALPDPSPMEVAVMRVDRYINVRGVRIDKLAAMGAAKIARIEKARLNGRMKQVTNGRIGSTNQVAVILDFIRERGVEIDRLRAADVRDILADAEEVEKSGDLDVTDEMVAGYGAMDPVAREVLTLRAEASKASTAKLDALVNGATHDGRMIDLFAYGAAYRTQRWAGRRFQAHNLPRANPYCEIEDTELWYETLASGDYDAFRDLVPPDKTIMDALKASLRGFVLASPGRMLMAADLNQIEARAAAWIAGQWDIIDAFVTLDRAVAAGADEATLKNLDIYTVNGRKMGVDRQGGKIGTLACFGPDTLVITRKKGVASATPIVDVTLEHEVWDGQEWVSHSGLVPRGARMTLRWKGVSVTGDHRILCGRTWIPARFLSHESTSQLALETGSENWSSLVSSSESISGPLPFWSNALVGRRRAKHMRAILERDEQPAACVARSQKQPRPGPRNTTAMSMSSLTSSIAGVCSTGYPRASIAATRVTNPDTTWAAAYRSGNLGGQIARLFSSISSRFRGGMTRIWNSIGCATTRATLPETSASSPVDRTLPTAGTSEPSSGGSTNSSQRMQTYDLALCGPRNRFAILTDEGPVIAHNCGYQGGKHALLVFANAYGMKMTEEKAEEIVDAWRNANPMIVRQWQVEDKAARAAIMNPGTIYSAGSTGSYCVVGGNLMRKLPSGRVLVYRKIRVEPLPTPWGQTRQTITYEGNVFAAGRPGEFIRLKTYGGKLFQNAAQAICRDILAAGLIRTHRYGLETVLHVHDENVTDTPAELVEAHAPRLLRAMTDPIDWVPDLPIASGVDVSYRYRKN